MYILMIVFSRSGGEYMGMKPKVLFLCTGNSARSQMALVTEQRFSTQTVRRVMEINGRAVARCSLNRARGQSPSSRALHHRQTEGNLHQHAGGRSRCCVHSRHWCHLHVRGRSGIEAPRQTLVRLRTGPKRNSDLRCYPSRECIHPL